MNTTKILAKLSVVAIGAIMFNLATGISAQAATIIDTTTSWNPTQRVSPFGEPSAATMGQTFIVGSDTTLDSFTFYVNGSDNPDVVDFAGYVMAWDGSKATGSILYQSAQQSTTPNQGMEQFTFNTGGINLIQGQQYVAFLSASNFFDGQNGDGAVGFTNTSNVYSDGYLVYSSNGNNFSSLTTSSWTSMSYTDLAFKATLSSGSQSVPEPASVLGLLTVGGLGLGGLKRKQKA